MIVQKKENAVSPAIATVLLVLMTVLLAAVIAAVVLGMTGDQTDYVVGLTADPAQSGGNVTVTLYGGKDLPNLVKAEVIDAGSAKGEFVTVWEGAAGTALAGVPLVAESVARPEEDRAEYATRILTKGTFADGTEQVLLERAVTFRGVQRVGEESGEPEDLRKDAVVMVTAKDQEGEFRNTFSDETVGCSGLVEEGNLISVTLTLADTAITPSAAKIMDSENNDVTNKYKSINYGSGTLTTSSSSSENIATYIEKVTWENNKVSISTKSVEGYEIKVTKGMDDEIIGSGKCDGKMIKIAEKINKNTKQIVISIVMKDTTVVSQTYERQNVR